MGSPNGRERPQKILVAMHKLSGGGTTRLRYEDIVVEAFRMFPDEFALRGHPEYPDASDIHKPLYGVLKKQGFVCSALKQFSLTPRGVETAERLIREAGASLSEARNPDRLTRNVQLELDRMLKSDAYRLFAGGEQERILDTDFYRFLGCTVRTARGDFQGRLAACHDTIAAARKLKRPDVATASRLDKLFAFLKSQFSKEIHWKIHGA